MRGREEVDLEFDPPPDLTIEVDVKHSSLNRMNVFAAVGIPEIWRYDAEKLNIYLLKDGEYKVSEKSLALPSVESERLTELVEVGKFSTRREFLLQVEQYSKELRLKN